MSMNLDAKKEANRIEAQMSAMQSTCFTICVNDFKGKDLTLDEVECVDKCAWKHLTVHRAMCNTISRTPGAVGAGATEKMKR